MMKKRILNRLITSLFLLAPVCVLADTTDRSVQKAWEIINYKEDTTYTGKGVVVGIADSYFNTSHPTLSGATKEIYGNNSRRNPNEELGSNIPTIRHGTQVAGLILGRSMGDYPHGLAPNAQFLGATYMNPIYPLVYYYSDKSYLYSFYSGKTKVVNHSWGTSYYPNINRKLFGAIFNASTKISENSNFSYDELIQKTYQATEPSSDQQILNELRALSREGVLQVFSSGNSGMQAPNLEASLPTYDESLRAWLNVGAVNSAGITKNGDGSFTFKGSSLNSRGAGITNLTFGHIDGAFSTFSNSFKGSVSYSLLAPGENLELANAYYDHDYRGDSRELYPVSSDNYFVRLVSGTSFSAPLVTGAAALVLEKYPFLSGKQVADVLLSTANSNIKMPNIIIKVSPMEGSKTGNLATDHHYYYDVIYVGDIAPSNLATVKDDLMKPDMGYSDAQAQAIIDRLYEGKASSMTKEELIGQGLLDVGKALGGLAKLDANRLTDADVATHEGTKQAFYTVDTKGYSATFDHTLSEVGWNPNWHYDNAINKPTQLPGITKIGFVKTGEGNLTLKKGGTYQGDTIVNGGTLTLLGGASLTRSDVYAENQGTFALAGGIIEKNATAQNNGRLLVQGSGEIKGTLSSKTGGVIELQKGSSLTVPNTIQNEGLLKGAGTIDGSVLNQGTVFAGVSSENDLLDTDSKLTITKNYTQEANAKLQLGFTKRSSSYLNSAFSAGSYTINGGTLEYRPMQEAYGLIENDEEIQLDVGGLDGELIHFKNVIASPTNILSFTVGDDRKTLNAKIKSNAFDVGNQGLSSALNYLYQNAPNDAYKEAFAFMDNADPGTFQEIVKSAGDSPTHTTLNAIDTTQRTLNVKHTLMMIRPWEKGASFGFNGESFSPAPAAGFYTEPVQMTAGFTYIKTDHDDYKQHTSIYDIHAKRNFDENTQLGAFLGLGFSRSSKRDSKIQSRNITAGLSASHDLGALGVFGSVSGGISFNDLDQSVRYLANSKTSGYYRTYYTNALGGVYVPFELTEAWTISPIAMLDYTYLHQESFKQHGGIFERKFHAKDSDYVRSWLGGDLSYTTKVADHDLSANLFAFQWHRFSHNQNQQLNFVAASDYSFNQRTTSDQDGLYVGAAFQVQKGDVFGRLGFSAENTKSYKQYEVSFRVGMQF